METFLFMFFTYILYSKSIDKYYVGHTGQTLDERLKKHLSNHKDFTGWVKDWTVYHYEVYDTKSQAYKRELEIKSKKSRKFIEGLKSSTG